MTKNEKARELIATSETTVKVDPQNGWYLKRFAALQFEGSVDNFGTNMPIHVLEQQLPKEDTVKLDDAVIEGQDIDYSKFYDEKGAAIMICAVGFVIEVVGMSPIAIFLEATGALEAHEAFLHGFEIILSCVCKVSFIVAVLLAFAAYKARWEL